MILSLDTAVIIEMMRQRSPVARDRLRAAVGDGARPTVSAAVLHELVLGSWLSQNQALERARIDETLLGIEVSELTSEDVEISGRVGALLRRTGRHIGDIDTLIAGQALARGWTVVTSNVRHFGRVEGLQIIDWTVGPAPLSVGEIAQRVSQDD